MRCTGSNTYADKRLRFRKESIYCKPFSFYNFGVTTMILASKEAKFISVKISVYLIFNFEIR